jgi:hypothetical protein
MLEREDAAEPFRELTRVLRALASVGFDQPALFPDIKVSAGELVREFDQRASVVLAADDGQLLPSQLESLTSLTQKLATMSKDGAEFDADIWTDAAVRTSEHWAEARALAAAALDNFSDGAD